ncbi:MAG: DUF362 domain-containing protein [Candidatus Hodarchaeota archaeon]
MSANVSRRAVLGGAAGLINLAGCSRRPRPGEEPHVSITRAGSYDQGLFDNFRRILAEHRIEARGKHVVLKPNLVEFDPGAAINTHPMLVHATLEAFKALGAAEVRIAEGPGHRRPTLDLADAAGYFAALPGFEQIFTDLNLDEVSRVELAGNESRLKSLYLPRTVLRCDLLVSMPKLKTHHWVGATLAMKNLFGLVPGAVYGWPKNVLHWAGIDECIVDMNATFPRTFAIVDGIEGMEGNGPIQGKSKFAGVIVAGSDLPAVDATCCRIMGFDPEKIRYLTLASLSGQTQEANVRQVGESIHSVRTRFSVIREFRHIYLQET